VEYGYLRWDHARRLVDAHASLTAQVGVSLPEWRTVSEFVQDFIVMSQAEGARFVQLYGESRARLVPLSDPLDVAFPLHRQLASSREEAYSDWLQWVLQNIADPHLILGILGSPNQERFHSSGQEVKVEREVSVKHGRQNCTGRLDLVVSQGCTRLAVIEVKTRTFSELDLEKHSGYRHSISSPETDLIFLSVDSSDSDLSGFRFLSWADVCVALRRIAPRLLAPERILGTSLILAFVGAVEQNLLGFVAPETLPIPISKAPRMVEHLTKALQAEVTVGRS
jgi:hypothetical protein